MGSVEIDGFQVDFQGYDRKTWFNDAELVAAVMRDWYDEMNAQDELYMHMEHNPGIYTFFLISRSGCARYSWAKGHDHGSMDKSTQETFCLADLQEEIFNDWVEEHKHDAIVHWAKEHRNGSD